MPKTDQIAVKAYRTSLDRQIEHLKPGSTCPAPTKSEFVLENLTLIKDQGLKVNIKVKKGFAFLYCKI